MNHAALNKQANLLDYVRAIKQQPPPSLPYEVVKDRDASQLRRLFTDKEYDRQVASAWPGYKTRLRHHKAISGRVVVPPWYTHEVGVKASSPVLLRRSAWKHDRQASPDQLNAVGALEHQLKNRHTLVGNVAGNDSTHGVRLHNPRTKKDYVYKTAFCEGFIKAAVAEGLSEQQAVDMLTKRANDWYYSHSYGADIPAATVINGRIVGSPEHIFNEADYFKMLKAMPQSVYGKPSERDIRESGGRYEDDGETMTPIEHANSFSFKGIPLRELGFGGDRMLHNHIPIDAGFGLSFPNKPEFLAHTILKKMTPEQVQKLLATKT